jgi:hypothetical protein
MKRFLLLFMFCLFLTLTFAQSKNDLFRVYKIWDEAQHNAFTDLIKYQGKYYCTFREGGGHVPWPSGLDGKIRILVSDDGEKWESAALLEKNDFDLRDSKLSVDGQGRLMILMGGSNYNNETHELICRLTHVSFYDNLSKSFSDPVPTKIDPGIKTDYDWLWRVTWHKKVGYGVLYRKKDSSKSELFLLKTTNGIDYDLIVPLPMDDVAGESTVTFDKDDNMIIIVRVDSGTRIGRIAKSRYPYTDWDWKETGIRLGGPNIIPYTDDWYLIGTRSFNFRNQAKTSIYLYREGEEIRNVVELPSGGDNSYPGMLIVGNELWISYYSSHEGKTSIYMAKIPLSFVGNLKSKS